MPGISWIEFCQHTFLYSLQHLFGENSKQLPSDIKGFKDRSVLVSTLSDEVLFEFAQEFQVEQIVGRQSFLTHHGLHSLHVFANSVAGVQLVGDIRVILASHALANGGLHQTRQGGQHVDWREDLRKEHVKGPFK